MDRNAGQLEQEILDNLSRTVDDVVNQTELKMLAERIKELAETTSSNCRTDVIETRKQFEKEKEGIIQLIDRIDRMSHEMQRCLNSDTDRFE